MSADLHRGALVLSLVKRRGWQTATAARAALAVHPLDDHPVPSRRYEKAVRKTARQVARALKHASESDANAMALQALDRYKQLAVTIGEQYYISRYDVTIAHDGVAVENDSEEDAGP